MSKRFYKDVAVEPAGERYAILLDGRRVNTPARQPLLLPTERLAEAIAEEWRAQGETIDPASMPLTGFANAVIDRIAGNRREFENAIAAYGDTDLLYYRTADPEGLLERQRAVWDPPLEWARRRYDVDFQLQNGVMHVPQAAETLDRLAAAVASRGDFALVSFAQTVPLSGSLVLMLAADEGAVGPEEAWQASLVDEFWQAELWGEDVLAGQARAARKADYDAAWRFRDLARSQT